MKQSIALDILKSGENVFITGSAGTGKTYLLNEYIEYLKDRRVNPVILAPTGIAASHLKGQTIHSFFYLGIRNSIDDGFIKFLKEKKFLTKRFTQLNVLIIDEVSMISPNIFSAMDMILRAFKSSFLPFGGVQVILSGDFFQLPPIYKEHTEKRFAWQSESWRDLDLKTCYLQQKFRQNDDKLISILDEIRSGKVSEASYEIFRLRYKKELADDFNPTKLYTHNIDVDRINSQELDKINEIPYTFKYSSKGNKKNIEKIFKSSLVLEELVLKKGAIVLFIKNSLEKGFINGTTGVVINFTTANKMPVVQTSEGKIIVLEEEDWSMENEKQETIAKVSQIPLRLAWAITIHKSQGMTLDCAEIDLSKTFEVGQGYVALSRIKNIEGLRLMGLNDMALTVDPLILKIDDRIKMASLKAQKKIEEIPKNILEDRFKIHIKDLGGVVSEKAIQEHKEEIKATKHNLSLHITPTHIKTKNLIETSKNILEIATKRGLTRGTIITHLIKIRKDDESIDLSKFKSNQKNFKKIESVINRLKSSDDKDIFTDSGEIKTKVIFDALTKQVGYDDIKLALLFLV